MSAARAARLALVVLALISFRAAPFDMQGHQVVGAVADRLLAGTNAEAQIKALLGGETLERFSIWIDCVKGTCPDWRDAEMAQYVADNPGHAAYHYTDIPIQEDRYFHESVGASSDDVVHILRQSIEVLLGRDTSATNPHGFSPRMALILIAHLVGDIHQPLHVGEGYISAQERYTNPNLAGTDYISCRGGNDLRFADSISLHAYWDREAVRRAMLKAQVQTAQDYAAAIVARAPVPDTSSGDILDWPQQWATEMLPIAARAYMPLELAPRIKVVDPRGDRFQWGIRTEPADYGDFAARVTDEQLAKAGLRLAALLKRIWP